MIHKKLFKRAFALLFIIGVLNYIGTTLYLYDSIWWYDIVLHVLSGVAIGISAVLAYNFFSAVEARHKRKVIFLAIVCAFIIGVVWEIYELYFDLTSLGDSLYVFDTTKDFIDDCIGGLIGSLYAVRMLLKK